jgi:Icc-related predicted phosphoesterase
MYKHGDVECDLIWSPIEHESDQDTILVIAGDLWAENRPFNRRHLQPSWISLISARFHSVVIVFGNHDYWDGFLDTMVPKAKQLIVDQGLTNVHILENESVVIGNIKFLGGTLWTDLNKGNPITKITAVRSMNDFRFIRNYGNMCKISANDVIACFEKTKAYIAKSARRDNQDQKVIVVTHHAPSYQSVHDVYKHDVEMNYAYYTDLDEMMYADDFQADYWLHGHMHNSFEYNINNTTVVCNPLGYSRSENKNFEDLKFLEI